MDLQYAKVRCKVRCKLPRKLPRKRWSEKVYNSFDKVKTEKKMEWVS